MMNPRKLLLLVEVNNLTLTSPGDLLLHCSICGSFPPSTTLTWTTGNASHVGPDITDEGMVEDEGDAVPRRASRAPPGIFEPKRSSILFK